MTIACFVVLLCFGVCAFGQTRASGPTAANPGVAQGDARSPGTAPGNAPPNSVVLQTAKSRIDSAIASPGEVFATVQDSFDTSLTQVASVDRVVDADENSSSGDTGKLPPESTTTDVLGANSSSGNTYPVATKPEVVGYEKSQKSYKKFYAADGYNSALNHLKSELLSKVPPDDLPLKAYIEANFPAAPRPTDGYITEGDVERTNSLIKLLMNHLRSIEAFLLDLRVKTVPEVAEFKLTPTYAGGTRTLTTNGTLTNLYRGSYEFTLTKKGFWKVHDTLNLIEQSGDTVECALLAVSETEGGHCTLK